MNTGFGGSADTRPKEVEELQSTLIRELHSGILDPSIAAHELGLGKDTEASKKLNKISHQTKRVLPLEDENTATAMPEAWVRASILIRINSLASGYSGVRPILVSRMVELLKRNLVPIVPLRGSISASGDLMPLSYLGGLLQGRASTIAWSASLETGQRRIVSADVALAEASLAPIQLGPKEGLAIINGTAVSTGVAALAMHDANNLAALSQVLTAMNVEALCGNTESFDPFFAAVRPHPGQIEAAQNIWQFLSTSKLVRSNDGLEDGSLRQDRYSIRTASQWLGPVLEDLVLASEQVAIECNSVTDNPLVDTEGGRVLHGGNFQARAITSAMEKTRLALQTIGQMLFAQCTELMDPKLNNGLPPNLAADAPSRSWLMKPLDIMIAALQSELGFLSSPVGPHVKSAEMGNQALNSLALISARYTITAIDVLSQLSAAHLFALCHALDLRALHITFLEVFEPVFYADTARLLTSILAGGYDVRSLHAQLWSQFQRKLDQSMTLDPDRRFEMVFRSLEPVVLDFVTSSPDTIPVLRNWTKHCSEIGLKMFDNNLESYTIHPDATPFIGTASRRMYEFVRNELRIPFLRTDGLKGNSSTGSFISLVYDSIRKGTLYSPVMESLAGILGDYHPFGHTKL